MALQRGRYLGLGVLSTWGARTGAGLHRLVCRRCTGCPSWESGRLVLSSAPQLVGFPAQEPKRLGFLICVTKGLKQMISKAPFALCPLSSLGRVAPQIQGFSASKAHFGPVLTFQTA